MRQSKLSEKELCLDFLSVGDISLWVLADEVELLILLLDEFCVDTGIFAADESLSNADVLVAPVEISEIYRAIHGSGYGMVAHFPPFYWFAGTFRCDT